MYDPWHRPKIPKHHDVALRQVYKDQYAARVKEEHSSLHPIFYDRSDPDFYGEISDSFAPLIKEIYQKGFELGHNKSKLGEKALIEAGKLEAKKRRMKLDGLTKAQLATLGFDRRGSFELHPAKEGRRQFMIRHMHSYGQNPRKRYERRLKSILLGREAKPAAKLMQAHEFLQNVLIEGFIAGKQMRSKG